MCPAETEEDLTKKFGFLCHSPGLMMVKDALSVYASVTQDTATLFNFHDWHDCIGKMDHEMPCKSAELAEQFRKMDRKVIASGKKMLTLEFLSCGPGWRALLINRNPIPALHDKTQAAGLLLQIMDVSNVPQFNPYLYRYERDVQWMGKDKRQTVYTLDDPCCTFRLTEKQEIFLFLLIRGKTIKEIANILGVSQNTIESRFDTLKEKMHCQYKSEVIAKAIDSGFLYYLPKSIAAYLTVT